MVEFQADIHEVVSGSQRSSTHIWRRRILRWAPRGLGILILVLLAFVGVDIKAGLKLLGHLRVEYLVPAIAVFCLAVLGRMTTWVVVASALDVGYRKAISHARVFLVGWFAGLGIPQGAAPLTRLAVIGADKRSVGRGVVAVGVERLLQVAVALVLGLLSLAYLSAFSLEVLVWVAVGIGVVAAGGLATTVAVRSGLTRPLGNRIRSYRRVRTFREEIKMAAVELRHMSIWRLMSFLGIALVAGLLTVTALFLASRALDIHIDFVVLMAAWGAVSLSGLLPISINGLGPREGILTAAIAGAGLSSEGGVALGLLWFFLQAGTRLLAGLSWFTVLHSLREDNKSDLQEQPESWSSMSRTGARHN